MCAATGIQSVCAVVALPIAPPVSGRRCAAAPEQAATVQTASSILPQVNVLDI